MEFSFIRAFVKLMNQVGKYLDHVLKGAFGGAGQRNDCAYINVTVYFTRRLKSSLSGLTGRQASRTTRRRPRPSVCLRTGRRRRRVM